METFFAIIVTELNTIFFCKDQWLCKLDEEELEPVGELADIPTFLSLDFSVFNAIPSGARICLVNSLVFRGNQGLLAMRQRWESLAVKTRLGNTCQHYAQIYGVLPAANKKNDNSHPIYYYTHTHTLAAKENEKQNDWSKVVENITELLCLASFSAFQFSVYLSMLTTNPLLQIWICSSKYRLHTFL